MMNQTPLTTAFPSSIPFGVTNPGVTGVHVTGRANECVGIAEQVDATFAEVDRLTQLLGADDTTTFRPAPYAVPAGFKLSIVIPVYNESRTIRNLLGRVLAVPLPKEIIIVDDCSTDGTRQVLQELEGSPLITVFYKPVNEGKGAAVRTGFSLATGDVVVVQDADLEYNPDDIPAVVRPIVEQQADVVFGSRFIGETVQDKSAIHRFGNRLLTSASNFFTGLQITDMETCYKAMRRSVLEGMRIRQNRFGFEPEITAKLSRRGVRICEVPIRYAARTYAEGKKIGLRDLFNALYCIVRYGVAD
ncbi:MAG: hypothetical protein RIS70_1972 [Planctomycetota bacterium]